MMPFTPYRAHFPPEISTDLQRAFDAAWVIADRKRGVIDEDEAKDIIAMRIVMAAQDGERDPERLKMHALAWFVP
jgi:hypothetical protein